MKQNTLSPQHKLLVKSISILPIVSILLLAAFLRLFKISEYMTFLGDEGRDVLVVRHIFSEFDIPFLGPTASVGGFFLGPMYYYLMAPFLWIWRFDPTGPAVMVALFGVATVYLLYKFVSESVSDLAGLIASSMYAVSPLVIAYSRSSWNPNLVPFASLSLVYLLWRLSLTGSKKVSFCIGVMLGFGIQFHYLFIFLFILVGVWTIVALRNVPKVVFSWMLIASGFVTGFLPFLLFELKHNFPNIRSIINFVSTGKDTGFSIISYFQTIYDVIFRTYGRLVLRMPQKEVWLGLHDERLLVWEIPIWFAIVASIGVIMWQLYKHKNKQRTLKKDQANAISVSLLWFCFSIALFGLYKREIYDYYLGIIFPFPFIAVSIFLWRIHQLKYGYILTFACWAVLIGWNLMGQPFQYPPNNQLGQMRNIALSALKLTDGKPFNFALATTSNSDHAYRYFFEVAGQKPVTILNKELDPERKTVTDQLIVICENECHPLGDSLWEIAGFGQAEIDKEISVPFVKIYRLVRYNKET